MPFDPETSVNFEWKDIGPWLGHIIQIATSIAGGVAAIYLIIGAIQYFTAYGDEAKATAAKNTILYAVIGVIVILLGKIIISEVWGFVATDTSPLKFWY